MNNFDSDEEAAEDDQENNLKFKKSLISAKERQAIKYKVNKNVQEIYENVADKKKRQNKLEKSKQIVRNSEMFAEMKHRMSDAPREVKSSTTHLVKRMVL